MVKLLPRRRSTKEQANEASTTDTATRVQADAAAEQSELVTTDRREIASVAAENERRSVMRVPTFSLLAPVLGWLLAWGVIATATAVLDRADVELGFNLGIADGGVGDDGFLPGLWLLLVSAGGFLVGGYAAARIARTNGMIYAGLVWVVAMVASAIDAIVETVSDGDRGAIQQIGGVPFWAESGLTDGYERTVVFVIFAAGQLVGSLVGGGLGQAANRIDRSDDVVVARPGDAVAVSAETPGRLAERQERVVEPRDDRVAEPREGAVEPRDDRETVRDETRDRVVEHERPGEPSPPPEPRDDTTLDQDRSSDARERSSDLGHEQSSDDDRLPPPG